MTSVPAEPPALVDRARRWLEEDPDPETRAELSELVERRALGELHDRFGARLEFGTAGLRGALGAGPNRMNRAVVIRTTAGLVDYLRRHGGGPVVIGFDARHKSDVFAHDTAAVVRGAGLPALLLPRPLPTPVLAYAVRRLGCAAGVMVTASHNPPRDNGYKVYLGDGSQIVPPADREISAAIEAVGQLAGIPRADDWQVLGEDIVERYLTEVTALADDGGPRELRIVYTPLHGVGGELVGEVLRRAGFPDPLLVDEQQHPDPDFPTVAFPNPEEPGAMDLALGLAEQKQADIVLANDPDADRCAVAVRTDGGWRMLGGDDVGVLLADHLIGCGARGTYATTIVSSSLLSRMTARHGISYAETLTGFKWLAKVPDLAYAYEEALGYCVAPSLVRDKDGVSAVLVVAQLAARLAAEGRTLLDRLDDIARAYGHHATAQVSVRVSDLAQIPAAMSKLRSQPPAVVGGMRVQLCEDLLLGVDGLPPTEGLRFTLAGSARVIVRPSGTEPKLKCYLEVVVPVDVSLSVARAAADRRLAAIRADLAVLLGPSAG